MHQEKGRRVCVVDKMNKKKSCLNSCFYKCIEAININVFSFLSSMMGQLSVCILTPTDQPANKVFNKKAKYFFSGTCDQKEAYWTISSWTQTQVSVNVHMVTLVR